VLLITDGLERDPDDRPPSRSIGCIARRQPIWLNPAALSGFEAKAGHPSHGSACRPARPIHNLDSMAELVRALGEGPSGNPKRSWKA
jgi:uncharacterized protein with von Willebrand factor type A (vWA) domain